MKKLNVLFVLLSICRLTAFSQPGSRYFTRATALPASKVDFDAFEALTKEVKEYRKDRLVNLDKFLSYAKEKNTVILDTWSTAMYNRKYIKGGIHLDFTDFTQENLLWLIPSTATRILFYSNNNFDNDEINFATKVARPAAWAQKPEPWLLMSLRS